MLNKFEAMMSVYSFCFGFKKYFCENINDANVAQYYASCFSQTGGVFMFCFMHCNNHHVNSICLLTTDILPTVLVLKKEYFGM